MPNNDLVSGPPAVDMLRTDQEVEKRVPFGSLQWRLPSVQQDDTDTLIGGIGS